MILEGKNLRKTYGFDDNKVDAIKNLSIDIEEGTFVAIVGRSGSGKSTLLHVLGGFRVIIVTVANSLGNIRVFELLPKLKTKKYGWCIA